MLTQIQSKRLETKKRSSMTRLFIDTKLYCWGLLSWRNTICTTAEVGTVMTVFRAKGSQPSQTKHENKSGGWDSSLLMGKKHTVRLEPRPCTHRVHRNEQAKTISTAQSVLGHELTPWLPSEHDGKHRWVWDGFTSCSWMRPLVFPRRRSFFSLFICFSSLAILSLSFPSSMAIFSCWIYKEISWWRGCKQRSILIPRRQQTQLSF